MTLYLHVAHAQAFFSVALLIAFLVATTLLQQRASLQSKKVLEGLSDSVKTTQIFASAERYFARREIPNLFASGVHKVPVWFLIIVVSSCSVATYFGAEYFSDTKLPRLASYVLGGAYAANSEVSTADLNRYQSGTVFIGSMAFLGAYIWTISQLMNRINNDDMNPATYYYLSIRILSACLVAGIARHIVEALPLHDVIYNANKVPLGLAVLGFLIGWNPTLWINELLLKAGDLIKQKIPSQRWPEKEKLPLNLTLLMVQGMLPDTIDRMNELNIDNCQKLASENPVIIWSRTSYTLELVVDWIAQAQLCIRFEPVALQSLREMGIRDIFSYGTLIGDTDALQALSEKLDIPKAVLSSHRMTMQVCPALMRLTELRAAMLPGATSGIRPAHQANASSIASVLSRLLRRLGALLGRRPGT